MSQDHFEAIRNAICALKEAIENAAPPSKLKLSEITVKGDPYILASKFRHSSTVENAPWVHIYNGGTASVVQIEGVELTVERDG